MRRECSKIASTRSRLLGDEAKTGIVYQGVSWAIGKTTGTNIEFLFDMKDLINYAPLYIRHIFPDTKNRKIAISIPAETYYTSQMRDDGGLVGQMINSIKTEITDLADVKVFPQGVVALNYLVNAKKVDVSNGNMLIIDGGFNTVNSSVVQPDGTGLYTETYYNEIGVNNLLTDFFRKELMVKYAETTSNPQMLKKAFLEERFDAGFTSFDITNEKKRAVEAFVTKLITRITNDLRKKNVSFDQFTFVGGLSYYIKKEIVETTKPFYVPETGGEFLTLLGMAEVAGDEYDLLDLGFGDAKFSPKIS
ncbi:acetate and sugar kinases/Hsc70/actin family protein [Sulfurospirillum multivorans]|uniref:Plasmid segregation protein ParM-like n=2 Tax=Sulfurospirillum multivorans TaxID=66821 RepID=A0AA86DYA1_SULMK|nr:hypothetical protein [Sulfurospirillum multivorans]AHJ12998.1 putative plasmid segregation protein ParM-like [Sulfurospirillum multivorans DSM 12446]QEH06488.1 putative plasmid segregation protein ParM-like [Sulfurospirillum multivorans]